MAESAAQAKARMRREKRAGAAAERLTAITKLQGGSHRDVEQDIPKITPSASPQPQTRLTSATLGTETPDPDEIDISQHHYNPPSQPRLPSPFAFDGNNGSSPFGPGQQRNGGVQDPMMALMQQMMGGGMPGEANNGGPPPDLPPNLANLFSAMQGGPAQDPPPEQSSAWLWRLVHSLFSLGLAIFIVLRTPFTGSKLARGPHGVTQGGDDWMLNAPPTSTFAQFFYMFATFEVAMQTSRYFVEKGQLHGNGWLNTIGQVLPEPYAGYVRVVGRYSVIYNTVVSDAMVVVFVLGAASWWNGGAIA